MTGPALNASQATMTAQIQVIRAGTGKVEDWTLTFTPINEQTEQEIPHGSDPLSDTSHDSSNSGS